MYSLHSWGSPFEDDGLYSFDPSCVSVQAYLQLAKADWKLHHVNNSAISPTGCLPVLTCQDGIVESGFWHIIEFLRREGYNLNSALDDEQISQSAAYISLVQDSLADAMLFSWYMVSENFVDVIRPRLAKMFGFPLSMVIPTQLKDYAEQRLVAHGICETKKDDKSTRTVDTATNGNSRVPRIYLLAMGGFQRHSDESAHPVYKEADRCLDALSKKLGSKQYFFGDSPSTLDAVVYGYLSLILYPELPQSTLKQTITSRYPSLVGFCDRVHSQISKPEIVPEGSWVEGLGAMAKQQFWRFTTVPSLPIGSEKPDPQRALKVRSVVGGLCVFFGYIIYNGILSAPRQPKKQQALEVPGLSVNDMLSAVRQPTGPSQ